MVYRHRRALIAATIVVAAAFGVTACGDGQYVGAAGGATTTTVPSPLAVLADPHGPTESKDFDENFAGATAEQEEFYMDRWDELGLRETDWAGSQVMGDGTITVYLLHGVPVPPALAARSDARIVRVEHSTAELRAVREQVEEALAEALGNPPNYTWNASDGTPLEDNVVWVQFGPDMTWDEEARAAAVLKPFIDRGVVKVDAERRDIYGTDL